MVVFNTATANVIYVKHNATGNGTGTNWANAYTTIYSGLAAASQSDTIWVAKGTYYPATPAQLTTPLNINLAGIKLFGGFAGTETSLSQRDITKINTVNATIVSGDYQNNDVVGNFNINRSDNANTLIKVAANRVTIDGFTLKGAYALGSGSAYGNNVIKVTANIAKFVIANCNITDNFSSYIMFDWRYFNTYFTVENTSIVGNKTNNGLMLLQHGSAQYSDLYIKLINVLVADNKYSSDWGAIWFRRGLAGNVKRLYSFIINSTIANNTNLSNFNYENTINVSGSNYNELNIWNSILLGNKYMSSSLSTYDIKNNKVSEGNSTTVSLNHSYISLPSSISSVTGGNFSNISLSDTTAPQLDSQYMPILGSSSINAGLNVLYDQSIYPLTDLAANARFVDSLIDVGVYEFQGVTCATEVTIPDVNFKSALLNNFQTIDSNNDGIICTDEAQAFTGTINASHANISDLTGIEAFPNISNLLCNNNNLTSIDLTNNTALQILRVNNNSLLTLDLSNLTNLTTLHCYENNLTSLDISHNANLTDCYANSNNIISIDASMNSSLSALHCDNNNLVSLNVANGNNANMIQMLADVNPNLSCIQIDNNFTPNTNWIIDATASFSTNCSGGVGINQTNNISDINVYLQENNFVSISGIENLKQVEVYNSLGEKLLQSNEYTFSIGNYPSGIYIVRIVDAKNMSISKKILKY